MRTGGPHGEKSAWGGPSAVVAVRADERCSQDKRKSQAVQTKDERDTLGLHQGRLMGCRREA